jgi:hypothetical protein
MAALDPTKVSTVDDLEHALEERLETGHIIGLSLILDVLHMNKDGPWTIRKEVNSLLSSDFSRRSTGASNGFTLLLQSHRWP